MRILWNNLLDNYTPIASSERSGFPAINAQHPFLSRVWRTLALDEYFTIDAGAGLTLTADCAFIAAHNLANLLPNLIDRGDCESATPPMVSGETVPYLLNCTWDLANWQHHDGSNSRIATKTVAAGTPGYVNATDSDTGFHGLIPGHQYTISAWVKIPSGQTGLDPATMLWIAIGDGIGGTAIRTFCQAIYDSWQLVTATGVLPLTATKACPRPIQFGSTAPIGAIAYVDDIRLDDVTGARIQANDTNDWASPDLDEAITWDAGNMIAYFASTTARFWRFQLVDATNPDGYIEIGRLALGAFLQMPPVEPGVTLPTITTTIVSTSITGQTYGDRGEMFLTPAFAFPIITHTERGYIETMWRAVEQVTPVFLDVWEDSPTVQRPIYCKIDQDKLDWQKSEEAGLLWSVQIAFMEAK